jgi:hypothetical protein
MADCCRIRAPGVTRGSDCARALLGRPVGVAHSLRVLGADDNAVEDGHAAAAAHFKAHHGGRVVHAQRAAGHAHLGHARQLHRALRAQHAQQRRVSITLKHVGILCRFFAGPSLWQGWRLLHVTILIFTHASLPLPRVCWHHLCTSQLERLSAGYATG